MMQAMRRLFQALAAAATVVVLILGWNYLTVGSYARTVTAKPGNNVASVWTYYAWGVMPGTLVVDVRSVSDQARPIDMLRLLFEIAEQAKERQFTEVRLAYQGETKFLLDADRFRTIGRERSFQNPIYVMHNLPAALRTPDGSRAFGVWTGGWLGVATRQMEDLNKFMDAWFIRPSTTRR